MNGKRKKRWDFFPPMLIVFFPDIPTAVLLTPNTTLLTKARGTYFEAVIPHAVEEHAVVGAAQHSSYSWGQDADPRQHTA